MCIQDDLYLFVGVAGGIHSFYQIQKGIYEIKRKISLWRDFWIFSRNLKNSYHVHSITPLSLLLRSQLDRHSPSPHTPQTALFLTLVLPTSPPEFPDNSRGEALAAVIKRTEAKDWIHNPPAPRGRPAAVWAGLLQYKLCSLALPQQERTGNQHFYNALGQLSNLVSEMDAVDTQSDTTLWKTPDQNAQLKVVSKLSSINPTGRAKPIPCRFCTDANKTKTKENSEVGAKPWKVLLFSDYDNSVEIQ